MSRTKKRRMISNILHITQTNHNCIESENDETPAIREGLTNKRLSWNDIFNVRMTFKI